jgi:hypothetical protein
MSKKVRWLIVTGIPIALYDLYVLFIMHLAVKHMTYFTGLYLLMGIAFIDTVAWVYYVLGLFEEDEDAKEYWVRYYDA